MDTKSPSANWKKLQARLKAQPQAVSSSTSTKRKFQESTAKTYARTPGNTRPIKKQRHGTQVSRPYIHAHKPGPKMNGETSTSNAAGKVKDNINAGLTTE